MDSSNAILLVGDNEDDEKLMRRALSRQHIANPLVVMRDGPEALAFLLGTSGERVPCDGQWPLLVLLDLSLPTLGGIEVIRQMRLNERTRELPVIALASSRDDEMTLKSLVGPPITFMKKPFDLTQFSECIRASGLRLFVVSGDRQLSTAS